MTQTRRATTRRRAHHASPSGGYTSGGSAAAPPDAPSSRRNGHKQVQFNPREEIDAAMAYRWRATRIAKRLNPAARA